MSDREIRATEIFEEKRNCAQAVLGAFCEDLVLDRETAFRLTQGFCAGMLNAEVCGAVSGAVLVLGLKYGDESKDSFNERVVKFHNSFKKLNKSIVCKEILGCNITTKEGREKALKENLFDTTCIKLIRDAVVLLEEMGI